MDSAKAYHYVPKCSIPGCNKPAQFKIAAVWTSGNFTELKNYGLSCEAHKEAQLERARASRVGVHDAEGESLGQIQVFDFQPGARDADRHAIPGG